MVILNPLRPKIIRKDLHCNPKSFLGPILAFLFLLTNSSLASAQWTQLNLNTDTSFLAVHFVDASTGWITGAGVIKHTNDGGSNWNDQGSGVVSSLKDIQFLNADTGYCVGNSGKVVKTTDGGANWTDLSVSTNDELKELHFIDASTGWVVGENGSIYQTSDGASSWTDRSSSISENVMSVYFSDASNGWVSLGSGEILHTTDGGSSWTQQYSDLYDIVTLGASGSSHLWGFGITGKIFHSSDGGSNWSEQYAPNDVLYQGTHFISSSEGWVVGGEGNIHYTSNGGSDWNAQWSGTDKNLTDVHFPDGQTGWAVGWGGTVLKATNSGVSIEERSSRESNIDLYPNPAKDRVTVDLDKAPSEEITIQIRDTRGREVRSWEESFDGGGTKFNFNVDGLDEGIYFLAIEGSERKEGFVKKLAVE